MQKPVKNRLAHSNSTGAEMQRTTSIGIAAVFAVILIAGVFYIRHMQSEIESLTQVTKIQENRIGILEGIVTEYGDALKRTENTSRQDYADSRSRAGQASSNKMRVAEWLYAQGHIEVARSLAYASMAEKFWGEDLVGCDAPEITLYHYGVSESLRTAFFSEGAPFVVVGVGVDRNLNNTPTVSIQSRVDLSQPCP